MSNFSKHPGLNRCQARVRAFAGDTHGNFAIITGLLLLPLVGFSSLAIDHWSVASAKSEIENAADAAALGAINRAAAVLRATGDRRAAIKEGQDAGQDQFKGNVGKIANTTTQTPKISVEIKGLEVSSKVEWSSNVKTTFGYLFNWGQQKLADTSASTMTMPAYVQIHVMVDNSSSMGIGATQDAQDKLFALDKQKPCAVACHLTNDDGSETLYSKARKAGIKTRIDVVRDVLVKVAERAVESSKIEKQVKIGVYTFSNDLVQLVKINDAEATNMKLFEAKLTKDFGLTSVGGGTNFHSAFDSASKLLTNSGDGTSEQSPLVYVMFITDGIEHMQKLRPKTATGGSIIRHDPAAVRSNGTLITVAPHPVVAKWTVPSDLYVANYPYSGKGGQYKPDGQNDSGWIQALNPNICQQVKSRGKLFTLEIEYIIPINTSAKPYWRHPTQEDPKNDDIRFGWIKDNILKNEGNSTLSHNRFRQCASTPQDAYSAKSDKDIETAISAMFEKVLPKPPRLLE